MKIAILGHSGSGKSTLARQLGEKYGLPVLHLDRIQFRPGWVETTREEKREKLTAFLDTHPGGWVIDGNYMKICAERRFAEADRILYLDFPRRICLFRVLRRWRMYRGVTRPDMGEGCEEKVDLEFLRWVLRDGRTPDKLEAFRGVEHRYPDKFRHFTSPKQLEKELEL